MEVQQDFRDVLELFNAHKVEYMIVGVYALAFHGYPTSQCMKGIQITGEALCKILNSVFQ